MTVYSDTFTQATSSYVEAHTADSGFTWTASQQMVYQVGNGLLYGPTNQTFKPAWFTLDSSAFTATLTLTRFGKMSRIAFRLVDRANYLYFRHDGLGNVVLGIRSGVYGSETDAILDTWTIPDTGDYFVATVVLTNSGSTVTIDINGTSHTATTTANRTATGIGFDSEPGAGNFQVDQLEVDTVQAPPLPPSASWDPAAFSGGSPITGYTLHMRTAAGDELTAVRTDLSTPLTLDLTPEMLAAGGLVWVTAENAAGSSQASNEVTYTPAQPPYAATTTALDAQASQDLVASAVTTSNADGTSSSTVYNDAFVRMRFAKDQTVTVTFTPDDQAKEVGVGRANNTTNVVQDYDTMAWEGFYDAVGTQTGDVPFVGGVDYYWDIYTTGPAPGGPGAVVTETLTGTLALSPLPNAADLQLAPYIPDAYDQDVVLDGGTTLWVAFKSRAAATENVELTASTDGAYTFSVDLYRYDGAGYPADASALTLVGNQSLSTTAINNQALTGMADNTRYWLKFTLAGAEAVTVSLAATPV